MMSKGEFRIPLVSVDMGCYRVIDCMPGKLCESGDRLYFFKNHKNNLLRYEFGSVSIS